MIKILVAGDYVPQYETLAAVEASHFEQVFGDVKEVISGADYSIVNLECPLRPKDSQPIQKSGPNLGCDTPKMIDSILWAGFNCVTLANNHFRDYGNKGVDATINACVERKIDFVGGGRNIDQASSVLYKTIDEKTIAVINACEEEYSIATSTSGGSNPLNPVRLYYDIKDAKQKADFVLVILHGGVEMYQLPTPRMQESYRFFIDAGADAIVNHHQHCYSGYERYNGHPIFYGLGNFCFNRPSAAPKTWHEGYMVQITFSDDNIPAFELIPYTQCDPTQATHIMRVQGDAQESFQNEVNRLNEIISSPEKLLLHYKESLDNIQHQILMMLEPFKNPLIRKLQWHHLLPHSYDFKQYLTLLDLVSCESHREKLISILRRKVQYTKM